MENVLDTLSGIERVRYLKALIEKVNNIGSKYATNSRTQPPKEESHSCSACASKTKRFMLEGSRNSAKIDLKRANPISQKCDVHRLKFVRHPHNDSKTSTANVFKCEVKTQHQREPQTEMKSLEAARDASFEAEKNYLRKIYSRKATNEVDNHQPQPKPVKNIEIRKKYTDGTQTNGVAFYQMHLARVDAQENIRPAIEQSRPIINAVLPQQSETDLTNSIMVERGGKLIGDGSVTNRDRTVAVANAQQSISDPLITVSSDGTRRIVFAADSQLLKPTAPWSLANLTARRQEIDVICECVFNVTASHTAGRNLIFVSDQIRTDLSKWLLRRADRSSKIISSAADIARNVGFFLFIHDTVETSFVEMLARMPPNDVMRFVVVFDFQDKIVLRRIQTVLEEFWLHRIIDVVVLVPFRVSKNVRVYTYQPYSPTRCAEIGPPMLINVWNSANKAFLNRGDLFSKTKKVFNLYGCPLTCVGIHRPPESTIRHLDDNTWQLTGTGNKAFRFIEKQMNFTASIALYQKAEQNKDQKANSSTSTHHSYFDIAFGKFIRMLDLEPNTDFIAENQMDCFTWAVPHGIGRQPSIWTNYVIEFSVVSWLIIAANIIVVSVITRIIVRRLHVHHTDWSTYNFILFWTFSTFIGATVKLKSKRSPLRVFAAQWLLYSLVITAGYQAYMGSLMTVPRTEPELDRQTDLLNTSLNLVGRREMFHVLNESATNSLEFQRLVHRFFILPPVDFKMVINRMIYQRDLAVFTSKRELIYYAQRRRSHTNDKRKIHVFSDCVLKSYTSAFMLLKGSPFQHPIRSLLTRLFETGIYKNWDTDNIRDEIYHNIIFFKESVLILRELYGAFIVLFAGLGLSFMVFFAEMFVNMFYQTKH